MLHELRHWERKASPTAAGIMIEYIEVMATNTATRRWVTSLWTQHRSRGKRRTKLWLRSARHRWYLS